ncbi:MAG: hypothetical protein QGH60_16135 [Phycisphaerae bacterium]|jgi:hypothetical protein|nr:hypothetical protein [Phycisphaerae bacterium]
MFDFSSAADEFFVNVNLQTNLALPTNRETLLQFYEAIQREFPSMTLLYQRETGESVLEANREQGHYLWMELHNNRLTAGHFNPQAADETYRLHHWLLEHSVYFLGIGGLDVELLDVMFGFNLDYLGNRDEIVAQSLMGDSALGALASESNTGCIECEPSMVISLDDDCYLQARISLETRSSDYQVRTGRYDNEPISVYFTVRRMPTPGVIMKMNESLTRQCEICEDICRRIVIPKIIHPIAVAIASSP